MKAFFDTSALIPIFDEDHPDHLLSVERLRHFDPSTGSCGAHSLVEVYSTLTRMPPKQRVRADQAILFISSLRERLATIALTNQEYVEALTTSAALSIIGGNIHDAMLARCALKSGAEIIYTWNTKHYAQCGPEVVKRLRTP